MRKSVVVFIIGFMLTVCGIILTGCGTQTAPTVAAVTATLAQAKNDVQNAINLYEFSKGVAGVAVLAKPTLAPDVAKATDLADPIAVKAQLALNDTTADAAMLEALVSQVTQLANALTLQTANVIKVVPAS